MSRRVGAASTLVAALALAFAAPAASQSESDAEALFMEAEGLLRLGRTSEAEDRYHRIVADYPAARFATLRWRAAARVRIGDLRWRDGARGLAGAHYVGVMEEEPASAWTARAQLGLAAVALADEDWVSAVDLYQRVVLASVRGEAGADAGAAAEARRRLGLIQRFRLAPASGEPHWSAAELLNVPGVELDRPVAVGAGSDGSLLIVDEGAPTVLLISADNGGVSRLRFNAHERPWWGVDGLPYLPTRKSGVIALGGLRLGFRAEVGGRSRPLEDLRAGTRAPNGRWYLLDFDPRRVLRFDPDGDYEGLATRPGEQPVDVAVDAVGRLHVLDRAARAVYRFDPDGSREGVAVSGAWRRPEALDVDALGNIYILDRDARTVEVYAPDGSLLRRLGPTLPGGVQLEGPRDVSVDGVGRIYVADRNASAVAVIR